MFCATSCVLSICLNLPKKREKTTLSFAHEQRNVDDMEVLVFRHAILSLQGERLFQQ